MSVMMMTMRKERRKNVECQISENNTKTTYCQDKAEFICIALREGTNLSRVLMMNESLV